MFKIDRESSLLAKLLKMLQAVRLGAGFAAHETSSGAFTLFLDCRLVHILLWRTRQFYQFDLFRR